MVLILKCLLSIHPKKWTPSFTVGIEDGIEALVSKHWYRRMVSNGAGQLSLQCRSSRLFLSSEVLPNSRTWAETHPSKTGEKLLPFKQQVTLPQQITKLQRINALPSLLFNNSVTRTLLPSRVLIFGPGPLLTGT